MTVLFLIPAIHQDVVKVHNHTLANDALKCVIHKSHKGAWCISQTKGHHKPLIESSFGFESHVPFIFLIDPNLITATSKINLKKDGGSM